MSCSRGGDGAGDGGHRYDHVNGDGPRLRSGHSSGAAAAHGCLPLSCAACTDLVVPHVRSVQTYGHRLPHRATFSLLLFFFY